MTVQRSEGAKKPPAKAGDISASTPSVEPSTTKLWLASISVNTNWSRVNLDPNDADFGCHQLIPDQKWFEISANDDIRLTCNAMPIFGASSQARFGLKDGVYMETLHIRRTSIFSLSKAMMYWYDSLQVDARK
jgi:hypothetical protein